MRYLTSFTIQRRGSAYALATFALFASILLFRQDLLGKTLLKPDASAATTQDSTTNNEQAKAVPVAPPDSVIEAALHNPSKVPTIPPEYVDAETLWLARVIYSESKRPHEQELVAWVVRNRVETTYRGKRSYRDVILDPYQFSAFNPKSRKSQYYRNLGPHSNAPGWQKSLALAYYVRHAPQRLRPFSHQTRHFYSERSLQEASSHPTWTEGLQPVTPQRNRALDAQRFRFYEGVM